MKSRVVDYKQGDTPLQGLLAWDDAAKGKRPGILVVHEWWGNNQRARNQALRLAKFGLDALAYNAEADKKPWAAMLATFKQVFKS